MGLARGNKTAPNRDPRVHVFLLGRFAVTRDGDEYDLGRPCQRLVALLALRGPLPISRERAAGLLWDDVDGKQAATRLRTCLYRFGPITDQLIRRSDRTLSLASDVVVDHDSAVARGRRLCDPTSAADATDLETRTFAFDLLPGWDEDWVIFEREAFQQLRFAALEAIAARCLAQGRYEESIQACLLVTRSDPLRESAHRLIARAHASDGNYAQALRELNQYAKLLEQEMGTRPSEFVIDLRQELLRAHEKTRSGS